MKETKFKNTEIGKIPEEWKMYSIGKDCSVKARIGWQGLTTSEYLQTGHYGLITSTDLIEGKVNWDTCVFVSEERYKQDTNIIVKNGDVLVSKDGTIGKVAVVSNLQYPTTLNSGVFVIRTKNEKITQEGLGLVFISPYFKDFIKRLTAGSTIVHLYQKDIVNFTFPIPTLPEQHRIASALTSIDNLISSLGKLIEKKKNIKQGAMQQLLTRKTRLKGFNEPWMEKKLGDVAVNYAGLTYSPMNVKSYGTLVLRSSNIQKGILVFNDNVFVDMDIPSRAIAKKNDLLICVRNGSKAHIGKSAVITDYADGMAFGAFMTILHANDIQQGFLNYLWQADYIQQQVKDNMGATINQITNADIEQFKIVVPHSLKEQQAIATILTKMDNEITALEAKRAKYEAIKQGMMQQLLTGKIRLIS